MPGIHHLDFDEAWIISKVSRFDLRGKKLLEVSEKYYLTDIGLSHAFGARRRSEIIYIQVCYLLADDTVREREIRPFRAIKDNFPKLLLTMDRPPESNEDGIICRYLPDWLMDRCAFAIGAVRFFLEIESGFDKLFL